MQANGRPGRMRRRRSRDGTLVVVMLVALAAQLVAAPGVAAVTPQTITFSLPPAGVVGSTVVLAATSDSGLPIGYATSTPEACAIDATTLSLVAVGSCSVTASQPGDETYDPAADVEASVTVEAVPPELLPQAITFSLPASNFVGSTVALGASSDSGLPIGYATSTPDTCTIEGTSLSLAAVGSCSVTASQPGDVTYAAAADVEASLVIEAVPPEPMPQAITFALPASGLVGSSVVLSATSDSGLQVTYATSTPDFCAIDATTLSLVAVGICSVTAAQPGDATHDPAADVTATVSIRRPQAITFQLPTSGVKGGTVLLAASSDSQLAVTLVSTTPATCSIADATLELDGVGACSVAASQTGDATWAPADDVIDVIQVKLPPLTTPGGDTNLGRYAFNGPIRAMAVDQATGIAYVGGDFTQIGIRTGPLAIVGAPGSGSDELRGMSPDVIGTQMSVFADDATGFFMAGGLIESIRGDGINRRGTIVRMTADGHVDPTWHVSNSCQGGSIPYQGAIDIGDQLVQRMNLSADASGVSTTGLVFVDKATGTARPAGAGSVCDDDGRLWPAVGPFERLADCDGWDICDGQVYDVAVDRTADVVITAVTVLSRESDLGSVGIKWYRVAYDADTGARLWTIEEGSYGWQMTGIGGALLVAGVFPIEGGGSSSSILLDAATGAVLQRWDANGEQDLSDPAVHLEPAGLCQPTNAYDNGFVRINASALVGFGSATDIAGGRRFNVCSYGVTGSGLAARLAPTVLGTFDVQRDVGGMYALPSTLYADRYLVGGSGAFDLETGAQLTGWNPAPSTAPQSGIVVGDSVVFSGSFAYIHGSPANHIAAIDRDLAPVPGFQADLGVDPSWLSAMGVVDGRVIAVGSINTSSGRTPVAALDALTGAVVWTQAQLQPLVAPWRSGSSLAIDPATNALYVGYVGAGADDILTRFVATETGFAVDPTFDHAFTPINEISFGNPGTRSVTALLVNAEHLYIGGTFASVDGQSRQGLARLDADGTLEAWAPDLIDEIDGPPDANWQLQPRSFVVAGDSVLVAGSFAYYVPLPDQQYDWHVVHSDVFAYSVETGARVRPIGTNDSWFDIGNPQMSAGAYAMVLIDDTIYLALGPYGIAALDAVTLDYVPSQSIRNQLGWSDSTIYALAARTPEPTVLVATHPEARVAARMERALIEPASTVVVGGTLNRWKNETAGNVVELNGAVVPGAPTGTTVERGNGRATVAWQAPTSDGGAPVTAYTATASPGGSSCTTLGAPSCLITGLSPATSYTVAVTATNSAGTGPASTPTGAFWPDVAIPTATVPATTLRIGVALSGTAVALRVTWTGADTGGSGVARYELARSANGGTTWTAVSASLAVTAFDLTAPTSGTIRFRVRAVDRAGNSGAWATGINQSPRLVQQSSTAVKFGGTWGSASSSAYSGGSVRYATRAGASVSFTSTGRSIALVSTRATSRGQVKVYVNGVYQATVSLYGSTAYRQVAWQKTWTTVGTRTIKLVLVGTRGRPRVDLDAFVTLT